MDIKIKLNKQDRNISVSSERPQVQAGTNNTPKEDAAILADTHKAVDKNLVAGLVKQSNRILASISTHKFPVDFFPDTINVEEGRVTVINRYFFFSALVHSIDIKDISNIFLNTSPFFAELIIITKTYTENGVRVKNLRKSEAIFVRRIIEGLRTFVSKQIDTSTYKRQELIAKLAELSTTEIVT